MPQNQRSVTWERFCYPLKCRFLHFSDRLLGPLFALDVVEDLGAGKIAVKRKVSWNGARDSIVDQLHTQRGVVCKLSRQTDLTLLEPTPLDGIVGSRQANVVRAHIIMSNEVPLVSMIPEPTNIVYNL